MIWVLQATYIILSVRRKHLNLAYKTDRARGYKTSFMLNSVEHKISNAHKYKNIKKFRFFRLRQAENAIFPAHKC